LHGATRRSWPRRFPTANASSQSYALSPGSFLKQLPKRGKGRTKKLIRTKELIKDILCTVEKYGGQLSYDKHGDSGTLSEVIAFLRKETAVSLANISPQTLQRLRSKKD
jgi:hypothetical protein